MTSSNRKRTALIVLSLIVALTGVFALASVSFASGGDGATEGAICVAGYVINHREVGVDGTRTDPNLRVEAQDPTGATLSEAVGADGSFKFEKLSAGDWNFMLQLPADWDGIVPIAPRGGLAETGATALADQKDCYHIVFKIRRLFDITAIKWEELLDGSVQPGADWEITFDPQGDPFVKKQTKKTNASGGVVFTVTPGSWVVSETVKPGWIPVTPPKVHLMLDQYAPSGAMDPVVFKNKQPPCTGGIVVEKTGLGRDANGGLVWLGPLAGWEVTVSRADGKMTPITKHTDGSGRVTFDGLKPGVYKVEEHMQKGWKAVSQNPQTVLLKGCETHRVLFENEEIAGKLTIHGKKLYRAWVPPYKGKLVGLSGWEIKATLVGTDISMTTVTNGLGEFWFMEDELKEAMIAFPGATVEVCEADRDNWIHVTPKCVTVMFPYPVPDDYTGAYVEFVNIQDPPLPGGVMDEAGCRVSYQVQPGDNLYRIAMRHGSSVSAIAEASGITNINYIRYGTNLCIP